MPVVIVSTEGNLDAKQKAEALGVKAYITKPIMANHVLATVKSILGL
jgi:DNA-binding response OmpR family regulator